MPRENKIFRTGKEERKIFIGFIVVITIVKIILSGVFSSDYQNKMFMPFVEHFIRYKDNVYEYYYVNQMLSAFPYPPLMLLIEAFGGWIIYALDISAIFLKNVVFKIPLLVCDTVLLWVLSKMCRGKEKYVIIFYYCSPIILYSTYMHGQLDIIPTMFLIVSIYYLVIHRKGASLGFPIFLIAAIATKFHIIAIVPLLFIYQQRKYGIKSACISAALVIAGVVGIVLPFWGEGFLHNVLFNKEQEVLTEIFLDYGSVKIYVAILAIALLYLKIIQLNYINKELLLCLSGIIFTVFLVCIPPMPGWFVWSVPFILFYVVEVQENKYKNIILYVFLCMAYVLYFIFFHKTGFVNLYIIRTSVEVLKVNDDMLVSVCFTCLVATLITIIFLMYTFGVQKNSLYQRANKFFTVGIAGDSGAGKSELQEMIEEMLGKQKVLSIEGDADHRWERDDKNWEIYTSLNPKANYLYKQTRDLKALKYGNAVRRREYNHSTGRFNQEHRIVSKPYIIICGLHSLYLPQMREILDLKIYMDTDELLRKYWKIQRDVGQRGYEKEKVISQIEKRKLDAEKYIHPQKKYADLSIVYSDTTLKNAMEKDHELALSVKIIANISMDFGELLDELEVEGLRFKHTFEEGLEYQSMIFDECDINKAGVVYDEIARNCIVQFDDLFTDINFSKNLTDGLVQLFIAYAISIKMRG